MGKLSLILCVAFIAAACVRNETDKPSAPAAPPVAPPPSPEKEKTVEPWELPVEEPGPIAGKLRLMHYNVENLFDTAHDEGKNDWEFLPADTPGKKEFCETQAPQFRRGCLAADWTPEKLQVKLGQIAKVVAKAGSAHPAGGDPAIPDLLSLVEVENPAVVRLLADRLGYASFAMTESLDERGIDVALMYRESARLQFVRARTERVDITQVIGRPARDILAVEFNYGDRKARKLAVLVNHWPSQANSAVSRLRYAERAREMAMAYARQGFDVVVTGDFNVDGFNDYPSPMRALEDVNGHSFLVDVDRETRLHPEKVSYDPATFAPGSYFYFNEGSKNAFPILTWNLLDRFFVTGSLLKRIDLNSYRILNDPEFTTTATLRRGPQTGTTVSGIPRRYSHAASTAVDAGFSDHFAITVDLGFE